ncbi:hypothetical protein CKAN_02236400 [Cinnamomum micranthum f. kanehirae]|uniref:Uncharacterized protein n=1 Tax=Cinnamomum micranthum f. kanehirae TaxID=337451 RepID=A0A3S3NJ08_9MAGN|nr:hypothetical protein CKAN_02236400 [Cinnamomum micranthum f. kanehirae]
MGKPMCIFKRIGDMGATLVAPINLALILKISPFKIQARLRVFERTSSPASVTHRPIPTESNPAGQPSISAQSILSPSLVVERLNCGNFFKSEVNNTTEVSSSLPGTDSPSVRTLYKFSRIPDPGAKIAYSLNI